MSRQVSVMTAQGAFGRYQVLGTLGRGGFATVYRAHDPSLDREVALKVLSRELAADAGFRQRFLSEARLLARLDHTNIVPVYDVGEADDQPFFAMKLIEGETLQEAAARNGPLALPLILTHLEGICAAVEYLHAMGLTHRDIKAANVMLERSGRVLLMDLGIARMLDSTQYTATGALLGTPEAMAPEQVLGQAAGPPADVYALGILTYKLLAGRPPFVGPPVSVLYAHAYTAPPPLEALRPDLPAFVGEAIAAALRKDPQERPPGAQAFLAALRVSGSVGFSPRPVHRAVDEAPRIIVPPTQGTLRADDAPLLRERTAAAPRPGTETSRRTQVSPPATTSPGPATAAAGTASTAGSLHADPSDRRRRVSLLALVGVALLVGGAVLIGVRSRDSGGARETGGSTITYGPPGAPGTVTTLAGMGVAGSSDGVARLARFAAPADVAVDAGGTVYVADTGNNLVRRVTADGTVSTYAGTGTSGDADGAARQAQFAHPVGIGVDAAGNVYVTDGTSVASRVRKITPDGTVTTLAGSNQAGFQDGTGAVARFNGAQKIAVAADGTVYVADRENHRVRWLTAQGIVGTLAGDGTRAHQDGPGTAEQFEQLEGIAVDGGGTVYVLDDGIRRIAPDGTVSTLIQGGLTGKGLTVDQAGRLYMAYSAPGDQSPAKILQTGSDGFLIYVTGRALGISDPAYGHSDGAAARAQFHRPQGVASGKNDVLYIADTLNNCIRSIVVPH